MCVLYDPQEMPSFLSEGLKQSAAKYVMRACAQAYCLVEATQGGQMESIGDNGYNLITKGVKDALDTNAAQPGDRVFTITAFCALENLQDFKLDPPRCSKSQETVRTPPSSTK